MDNLDYRNSPYVHLSDIRKDNDDALHQLEQEEQQMSNQTINSKLIEIQSELKTPKNAFNKFGGYNYRSAEDILEALKPILKQKDCYLVVQEEGKEIAGIPYIQSTATLTHKNESISATALAGINIETKGMSVPQSFGSSSSYAKKYSLGNLFLIDDTKDSDSLNKHGKKDNDAKTIAQEIKNNNEDPF